MGRGWKIAIGVVGGADRPAARQRLRRRAGNEGSAEVTVPGGRILDLRAGESSRWSKGARAAAARSFCSTATPARSTGGTGCGRRSNAASRHRHRPARLRRLGKAAVRLRDGEPGAWSSRKRCAGSMSIDATVVGHSLGGTVATALAELSPPQLVERLVIIDQAPDNDGFEKEGLPLTAKLTFLPVIGPALWQDHARRRDQGRPRGRLRARIRRPRRLRRRLLAADLQLLRPDAGGRGHLCQGGTARPPDPQNGTDA